MTGSILMLIGIVYLYNHTGTMNYEIIQLLKLSDVQQKWLFLSFFFAFAIKTPMWPFHTWLPEAHVQAPTTGSMVLAGLLLKLGTYGFIRFSLPLFPVGAIYFSKYIMLISVVGIIHASLMAFSRKDMKQLIAYSSIAHMGAVTLGIFTFNIAGVAGAIYQMIGHGLVSTGLFLCVGLLYFRFGSYRISDYGGIARIMPFYGGSLMILTLASIGMPLSIGFVGEFLMIIGALKINIIWASLLALGIIFSAVYMLNLYKNIGFGEMNSPHIQGGYDLKWYENISLGSIIGMVIFLGVYTFPLQGIERSLMPITAKYMDKSNDF
jgi:NADH-quinone oxidoreductase subunit M